MKVSSLKFKKRTLGIILVAGLLLLFVVPVAFATEVQTQGNKQSTEAQVQQPVIGPLASAIIYGFAWLFSSFLGWLLGFAVNFLEFGLALNISSIPANMPAVQAGWVVMRDIANSFFILILLWIALTIILNLEQLGGKKMLVRVVVIALLMNFSLVLVSTAFAFTNLLAKTFYDSMPQTTKRGVDGVAGFLTNRLQLNNLGQMMDQDTAQKVEQRAVEVVEPGEDMGFYPGPTFKDTLLASVGVQRAEAGFHLQTAAACAAGFVLGPKGCLVGAVGSLLLSLDKWVGRAIAAVTGVEFNNLAHLAVKEMMTVGFQIIALFAILAGAVVLLVRIVAMMLISVLAPLVFLLFIVPIKGAQGYFNKWLSALGRWAFFAPIYFFLFYLALLMIDMGSRGVSADPSALSDRWMLLLLAATFMVASLMVARMTAAAITDATISATKNAALFGLGLATGGAAAGAGFLMRRNAGAINEAMKKVTYKERGGQMRERPILSKIAAPATRKVTEALQAQKQKVDDRKKKISHLDTESLLREHASSWRAEDKVAVYSLLASRGKLSELEKRGVNMENALRLSKQFNQESDILKARPDLAPGYVKADENLIQEEIRRVEAANPNLSQPEKRSRAERAAAIRAAVEKIKTSEAPNVSEEVDAEAIRTMWRHFSSQHIANIARNNPKLMEKMMQNVETSELRPEVYRYVQSSAGRGLMQGFQEDHMPPIEIQKEEAGAYLKSETETRTKLNELERRATRLEQAGQTREARNIREVRIPELEDRLEELGGPRRRREPPQTPPPPQAPPPPQPPPQNP